MRVVMVSKALVVGAYQRKVEELAREPGIEVTAIVPPGWREGGARPVLDRAYTAGYELIVAPVALNGSFHLHFYPTLGRLLHRLRPDLLHMDEEPYNFATWHALRLGRAAGARCLFFTWQNLPRRYPWPFRRFEIANYRMASYAIAGNRAAADVLRAKGYRGPLAVIPQFGVDPDIFSPSGSAGQASGARADGDAPSRRGRDRSATFVIGYAGRLVPEKGIDTLLAAAAALPDPHWSLPLLGQGSDRQRLATLAARLGVADRVRFLGSLPSTRVVDFYRTLDVLVLPSVSQRNWVEQFGRVLIEAMACGVPVIGSDCGEIPHVIDDAGLVCREGDDRALRDALAGLMADPARRQALARAGRERVLSHFTQARIAAATAQVYREVMGQACPESAGDGE